MFFSQTYPYKSPWTSGQVVFSLFHNSNSRFYHKQGTLLAYLCHKVTPLTSQFGKTKISANSLFAGYQEVAV